jgi:hypothetical protein
MTKVLEHMGIAILHGDLSALILLGGLFIVFAMFEAPDDQEPQGARTETAPSVSKQVCEEQR